MKSELRDHVGTHIGAIAKPDEVRFAEALPKTRSGKIMRRLLKEIASGAKVTGDTTTLEDFSVSDEDWPRLGRISSVAVYDRRILNFVPRMNRPEKCDSHRPPLEFN